MSPEDAQLQAQMAWLHFLPCRDVGVQKPLYLLQLQAQREPGVTQAGVPASRLAIQPSPVSRVRQWVPSSLSQWPPSRESLPGLQTVTVELREPASQTHLRLVLPHLFAQSPEALQLLLQVLRHALFDYGT